MPAPRPHPSEVILVPEPVTVTEVHPHRTTTLRHRTQLVRDDRPLVSLDLELHYTSLDPFAVRIGLETDGASIHWALSRETLLLGLRRREGMGDVAVWPVRQPGGGGGRLRIRLGPPGSCRVFQTERDVISDWLDVTLRLVPGTRRASTWTGTVSSRPCSTGTEPASKPARHGSAPASAERNGWVVLHGR